MGVSPADGRNEGGSIIGVGYLCLPPPEHSCTVNCNQFYYGHVYDVGEASRVTGGQEVVISERIGPERDSDSGLRGGTGGGGGGYGKDSKGEGKIIRWEDTVSNLILGT